MAIKSLASSLRSAGPPAQGIQRRGRDGRMDGVLDFAQRHALAVTEDLSIVRIPFDQLCILICSQKRFSDVRHADRFELRLPP